MRTNSSPRLISAGLQPAADAFIDVLPTEETVGQFPRITPRGSARFAIDLAKHVAALSTEAILEMTRSELIDVIRSVRATHLRPGVLERLPQTDGDTLRRLVFLTRRYCRNQQRLAETSRSPHTFAMHCR